MILRTADSSWHPTAMSRSRPRIGGCVSGKGTAVSQTGRPANNSLTRRSSWPLMVSTSCRVRPSGSSIFVASLPVEAGGWV